MMPLRVRSGLMLMCRVLTRHDATRATPMPPPIRRYVPLMF